MKIATEVRACTACAGTLPQARWEALPLVETIEPDAILRCVSVWRATDRIEVRSCHECGRAIARTVKCARA